MKYVLDKKGRATTVGVPEYIDENIFDGCKAEVIVLPEDVKTIGEYAFCELDNLREIHIPPSVTRMEVNAFTDVLHLDRVYITDLAAWCGILFDFECNPFNYADELYLNGELISDLVIPNGVKTIGSEAFVGLRGIRSLTVPDGTTYIGSYAFMFCRNLAEVFISDTVEELAGFVFSGCGSLSNVYLGKNLKRMGVGVFENCDSLKSVAFGGTVAQWLDRFGGFSFEVRCLDGVVPAKNNG